MEHSIEQDKHILFNDPSEEIRCKTTIICSHHSLVLDMLHSLVLPNKAIPEIGASTHAPTP